MEDDQHIWRCWAESLQRWGVGKVTAALMEPFGAFSIVFAQFLYVCQPFAQWANANDRLISLTRLLEDPANIDTFIDYLHEAEAR
jgi:hypothetical protein